MDFNRELILETITVIGLVALTVKILGRRHEVNSKIQTLQSICTHMKSNSCPKCGATLNRPTAQETITRRWHCHSCSCNLSDEASWEQATTK